MTADDVHYYEPARGRGLRHDLFNAIVAPRPIGWISSHDPEGHLNLAPYNFKAAQVLAVVKISPCNSCPTAD